MNEQLIEFVHNSEELYNLRNKSCFDTTHENKIWRKIKQIRFGEKLNKALQLSRNFRIFFLVIFILFTLHLISK